MHRQTFVRIRAHRFPRGGPRSVAHRLKPVCTPSRERAKFSTAYVPVSLSSVDLPLSVSVLPRDPFVRLPRYLPSPLVIECKNRPIKITPQTVSANTIHLASDVTGTISPRPSVVIVVALKYIILDRLSLTSDVYPSEASKKRVRS